MSKKVFSLFLAVVMLAAMVAGSEPVGTEKAPAGEDAAVHLLGKLRDIAPVDEDHGRAAHHERHAGRAGEARQPGEALGRGRHIFALVFVGARHEEAVDAERIEAGAQRFGAFAAELGRGGDVETLEHGRLPVWR